ncbi:MAG TPA: tetratricopeptide repeat protein [Edaphocola sp.]|nr:tetratricopeptide repeat protein [Edaphocola sp.]
MKLKYIIPVAIALGLIALLNFGVSTKKPVDPNTDSEAPMAAAMGQQKVSALNLDSLLTVMKKKLPPAIQAKISLLENNITRGDIKEQQIADYESLGDIWLQEGQKGIAGHYIGLSGKLENSEKKLNFAAHLISEALNADALMPAMKSWLEKEAVQYYSASLAINPVNDTAKMELAMVYMDAQQPMKGVEQLLDIVRRDSTNIPANVMLGKMAVQSGQLDKAIQRGQTVLRKDPGNIDAHLFMGEAYKRKGNKAKAIQLFTEAKKLMNNPAFSKDVDAYISTF